MKIGLSIAGPVTAKGLETRDSREITMGLFPRKAGNKKPKQPKLKRLHQVSTTGSPFFVLYRFSVAEKR